MTGVACDPPGRPPILCLGTTPTLARTMIFGRVSTGGVNRTRQVHEYASGKPINVARVLTTLGREAVFIGPLGGGRGQRVRDDLKLCRIVDASIETPAQTRLCVTVIDEAAHSATELVEEHAAVARATANALLERLEAHLAQPRVLVMTGSIAAGAGDDFYARALRLAKMAGVPSIVDAHSEALRLALAQRPEIVKLNRAEAAATLDEADVDPANAAKRIAQMGCGWSIVTDGARGSWGSQGADVTHIPARQVRSISAIGSGDAYAAGLAIALIAGMTLLEACRLGAALGAANALTPNAGHLHVEDVDRL